MCNLAALIVGDHYLNKWTWRQTSSHWDNLSVVGNNIHPFTASHWLSFLSIAGDRNQRDQHRWTEKKLFLKILDFILAAVFCDWFRLAW